MVLVGGGPGDPELMSVAGRKALMEADVVVADRLAPRELLGELPADVELIDVAKLPRGRSAQQEEINRVIVERALAGQRVVRFKGGDNFVFGRGYEEVLACREAGVPVTVIPGLTSPIAVPAVAGIPVTHRGVAHDFTVVSGHLPPGDPESLVNWKARGLARRDAAADDGGPERAGDRHGPGRGRPAGRHPGRRDLRRHDAGGADGAVDPGRSGGGPGGGGGPAAGDHRHRRRGRGRASGTLRADMATLHEITDPTDPRLADYRDLRDVELRKHLEATHGLFLAEGEKVVRRAVEAGFTPRSYLMAPRWLDGLDDVLSTTDAPCYVVSEALAEEVTGFHVHRGALASLERKAAAVPGRRCSPGRSRCWCWRTSSTTPTSVRSSARAPRSGSTPCCWRRRCADPLYRRSIKVGMGAVFSMPWTRLPDWYDALPSLSAQGFTTVALTLADDASAVEDAVAGLDRVALVLGSEGHGLSTRWEQSADRRAIIPMREGIDSLNVAAATAVACYVTAKRGMVAT